MVKQWLSHITYPVTLIPVDIIMSAGIAKVFKRKLRRPGKADCINEHLACQEMPNSAAVFALVTKPQYFSKPKR